MRQARRKRRETKPIFLRGENGEERASRHFLRPYSGALGLAVKATAASRCAGGAALTAAVSGKADFHCSADQAYNNISHLIQMADYSKGYDAAHDQRVDDDLDRWRFAGEIVEVIESTPADWSARIGIFGKWGEGK